MRCWPRSSVAARGCACTYLWRPNLLDEADNHLVELADTRDFERTEMRFPALHIVTPAALIAEHQPCPH